MCRSHLELGVSSALVGSLCKAAGHVEYLETCLFATLGHGLKTDRSGKITFKVYSPVYFMPARKLP